MYTIYRYRVNPITPPIPTATPPFPLQVRLDCSRACYCMLLLHTHRRRPTDLFTPPIHTTTLPFPLQVRL